MLSVVAASTWAAILGIAFTWGADPQGPLMRTGYILAAATCFYSLLADGLLSAN